MGCGASSIALPSSSAQEQLSKPESVLANGHVVGNTTALSAVKQNSFSLTNNAVGPAPAPHPLASTSAKSRESNETHEISEVGDVLTVKRLTTKKLSSIEESVTDDSKRDAFTQTKRLHSRKKSSSCGVQTDHQLFPEDELEEILMTSSDIEREDGESRDAERSDSDDESIEEAVSCGVRPPSQRTDAATQSGRWTRSRKTQTNLSLTRMSSRTQAFSGRPSNSSPVYLSPRSEEDDDYEAKRSDLMTTHLESSLMEEMSATLSHQTPTPLSFPGSDASPRNIRTVAGESPKA